MACIYIGQSVYTLFSQGAAQLVPAFCYPDDMFRSHQCYPALPMNLIILSVFMLYSIRKWGWFAGPIAASAAVGYDLSFGGVTPTILEPRTSLAIFIIQVGFLILPFFLLRDHIKIRIAPSLLFFEFMMASGLFTLDRFLGAAAFPYIPFLALFCLGFDQSLIYEPQDTQADAHHRETGESDPA